MAFMAEKKFYVLFIHTHTFALDDLPETLRYAKHRITPEESMIKIPDVISDEVATAVLMTGMTVDFFMRRTYPIKAVERVFFDTALGGDSHLAGQWENLVVLSTSAGY